MISVRQCFCRSVVPTKARDTCSSRSNGLTCKNGIGHGWWLGRCKGYRIF